MKFLCLSFVLTFFKLCVSFIPVNVIRQSLYIIFYSCLFIVKNSSPPAYVVHMNLFSKTFSFMF